EARLHVVEIVLACLRHPGGLRALCAALETMAPYAEGTRRARQLIESATLSDLLSESDLERARDLLRSAGDAVLGEFEDLLRELAGPDGLPPALSYLEQTARQVDPHLAADLRGWVDAQAEWLEVGATLRRLRDQLASDASGGPTENPTLSELSEPGPDLADDVGE